MSHTQSSSKPMCMFSRKVVSPTGSAGGLCGALIALIVAVCAVFGLADRALALPDGRAYELVTPAEKNGADGFPVAANGREPDFNNVLPLIAAASGERFLFGSNAAYSGASIGSLTAYVAQRGGDGWVSRALVAGSEDPHPSAFSGEGEPLALDAGSELERVVFGTPYLTGPPAPDAYVLSDVALGGAVSDLSGATGGSRVGYVGSSADGSRVVFDTPARLLSNAKGSGAMNVYERDLASSAMRLVDILPDGTVPVEGARAGGTAGYPIGYASGEGFPLGEAYGAVAGDGSRVIFTARAAVGAPPGLYLRVNAQEVSGEARTLEVSASDDLGGFAPVAGAQFAWMTPDGRHVFFRDDGQLLPEASAGVGSGLYRYDVNEAGTGGSLALVSKGLAGAMGLVGASDDGQVAYFISESVLAGSAAVAGLPNLYVNDRGGVSFVATLSEHDPVMFGAKANGEDGRGYFLEEALEVHLAPAQGGGLERTVEARVSTDGGRLLFQSHASLTGFDNAGHPEVFQYTLGSPGRLVCVSCGPVEPALGGAELSYRPATPFIEPPLNLSGSGEWAFFESDEQLVPRAVNGNWNVYRYHDGRVSLISPGNGEGNARFLGASTSGRDVFFSSFSKLVPQDIDSAGDVYDARIGGGFPVSPLAAECAGSECQGQGATTLFSAPQPASITQQAGENVPPPTVAPVKKATVRKRKPKKKRKPKSVKAKRSGVERGGRVAGNGGAA